jgi:hypothetical protein
LEILKIIVHKKSILLSKKEMAKADHDVFEGPNRIYFEVGDSLGYVSDVKNKDARTEGMSYGIIFIKQLQLCVD